MGEETLNASLLLTIRVAESEVFGWSRITNTRSRSLYPNPEV